MYTIVLGWWQGTTTTHTKSPIWQFADLEMGSGCIVTALGRACATAEKNRQKIAKNFPENGYR